MILKNQPEHRRRRGWPGARQLQRQPLRVTDATCAVTNTAIDPRLTLVKQVVNTCVGNARATDWALAAAGPVPVDGATGTTAVTNARVAVGAYRLSGVRSVRLRGFELELHRGHPGRVDGRCRLRHRRGLHHARRVWLNGGRVLAVRRGDIPGDHAVAAIRRYSPLGRVPVGDRRRRHTAMVGWVKR